MIKKFMDRQEIRFLFVGVLNTIVGYGLYALFLFFHVHYLVSNTLATVVGVGHSYLWNRFFTFKSKEKASKEILKFTSVYIISYLIGTVTLFLFKNAFHLSPYIAGLLNLVITTIISYFGHKNFSFKKIEKIEFNSEKPYTIEWIFLGVLFLFLFVNFVFGDILLTTNASITFDDLFFKGDLYNLYAATYHTYTGLFEGTNITYDFPIYIFFGIWNLPLYIFTKLVSIHWENFFINVLYAKSFLIFLTGVSLLAMYKILNLFPTVKNEKKMYSFLFLSSSLFLMVITMFAGYDILSVAFALWGIYFYLKDDLKKFTFFFAIAISVKLFALFVFIPLLLLKEKKILKIMLYGIASISILLFAKLIYFQAPMYIESMSSFESSMFGKLYLSYITTPFGNISIFVTLYGLLCIWCYHKKLEDKNLFRLYTMYIALIVYGLFTIFCQIHPQWIILIVPYLIFFLVYNKKERKLNLLLESAFTGANLAVLISIYTGVFYPGLMNLMLIPTLFQKEIPNNLFPFLGKLIALQPIFNAIIVASFIYFLWINRPERLLKEKDSPKENWPHSILLLRMCIILSIALLIIYSYFR